MTSAGRRSPTKIDYTIAYGFSDGDLLEELRYFFEEHEDVTIEVNRADLSRGIGIDISKPDIERLFTGLVLNNAAEQASSSGTFADYTFSIDTDEAARVLHEQAIARAAIDGMVPRVNQSRRTEIQLAATFPPHLGAPENVEVVPIAGELRQLFFDTDEIIRIANPYFDPNPTMVGDLSSLAGRGVETRILTRQTEEGTAGLSKSLNSIHESIPHERRDQLIVRDLFERDSGTGRQAFATHAKIAIADDVFCYIGSANLTETNLSANFEMGVLVEGETVDDAIRIFDSVFAVARRVDLPL